MEGQGGHTHTHTALLFPTNNGCLINMQNSKNCQAPGLVPCPYLVSENISRRIYFCVSTFFIAIGTYLALLAPGLLLLQRQFIIHHEWQPLCMLSVKAVIAQYITRQ